MITNVRGFGRRTIAVLAGLSMLVLVMASCTASPANDTTPPPSIPGSGTVFYLSPGHSVATDVFAGTVTLSSRTGEAAPVQLGTFEADGERAFEMTVTVSPDGNRVAWLSNTQELLTSRADGSDRRTLASGVPVALCSRPIWTPDSRQIIFPGTADGPAQIINVDGSNRRATKTPYPCARVSLLDGERLAWISYDDALADKPNLVIQDINTGEAQRFAMQVSIVDVVSISPDARRAVVILTPPDRPEGDPPTEKEVRFATYPERGIDGTLLDVSTGQPLPAPVPGDIIEAIYHKDGTLLLRTVDAGTYWLSLLAPDGTVLAKTTEPATLAQHGLLASIR